MAIVADTRGWRRLIVNAFTAALTATTLALTGPTVMGILPLAAATDTRVAPVWSGLDVRDYAGPIPAQPGKLVDSRPLDPSLWLPNTAEAYRFVYSTPDQRGHMSISTAAMLVPQGRPPAGGWKVMAFAHGTVGLADDCTPSALPWYTEGAAYLGRWLREGYALVITDYQGLGTPGLHSYLNAAVEADSVANSVLAAHQIDVKLARQWVALGHSQGGQASLAAGRYAAELTAGSPLDYRGTVALAPGVNVEDIALTIDPNVPMPLPQGIVSYAVMLTAALRDAYPQLNMNSYLTPLGRGLTDRAETVCGLQLWDDVAGVQPRDLYTRALRDIPGFMPALREHVEVPTTGYSDPVLIAQGALDTDVPATMVAQFAAEMQAAGEPVETKVYPLADHRNLLEYSLADVRAFLTRVFS